MGKLYNVDIFIEISYFFIFNIFDDVWEIDDFLKFGKDDLEFLFCDECLSVLGEEVVCKVFLRWILVDEVFRKLFFFEFFFYI